MNEQHHLFPTGLCPVHQRIEELTIRYTCSGVAVHPVLVFSCGRMYNTPSV